jgi:hypothetical protein
MGNDGSDRAADRHESRDELRERIEKLKKKDKV